MNAQRALNTVANANAALRRSQYISPDERKMWRRAKRKANAFIKRFTDPNTKALPKPSPIQSTLFV